MSYASSLAKLITADGVCAVDLKSLVLWHVVASADQRSLPRFEMESVFIAHIEGRGWTFVRQSGAYTDPLGSALDEATLYASEAKARREVANQQFKLAERLQREAAALEVKELPNGQ